MKGLAAALVENETLEILDLRDNRARDDGARVLASSLRKNRTLRKLLLSRNFIENDGASGFVDMLEDNTSVLLDLTGNEFDFKFKIMLRKRLVSVSCSST